MQTNIIKELIIDDARFWDSMESGIVVIEYWNRESGACDIMDPVFMQLADKYQDVMSFYRCHVEPDSYTKGHCSIKTLPSYSVYKDQQLVEAIQGILPLRKLDMMLTKYYRDV